MLAKESGWSGPAVASRGDSGVAANHDNHGTSESKAEAKAERPVADAELPKLDQVHRRPGPTSDTSSGPTSDGPSGSTSDAPSGSIDL